MYYVKIKDKTKFTKQDKNNETIILTKIIMIFLNKYRTKSCRTINCTHKKKALLYSLLAFDASICSTMAFPPLGNYSKCDQVSDLWQQLELASELESDI